MAAIGYTGLAEIDGLPTHEWICNRLAHVKARQPWEAAKVLQEAATAWFSRLPPDDIYPQQFLLVGYDLFPGDSEIRPHVARVTNLFDEHRQPIPKPSRQFQQLVRPLRPNASTPYDIDVVGVSLSSERRQALDRNVRRLLKREIGKHELLRLLVDEIAHTHEIDSGGGTQVTDSRVSRSVLAMTIPRKSASVESFLLLSTPADENAASFWLFNSESGTFTQTGPAVACGEGAGTDTATEDDPARDFQSSQIRILRSPQKSG